MTPTVLHLLWSRLEREERWEGQDVEEDLDQTGDPCLGFPDPYRASKAVMRVCELFSVF